MLHSAEKNLLSDTRARKEDQYILFFVAWKHWTKFVSLSGNVECSSGFPPPFDDVQEFRAFVTSTVQVEKCFQKSVCRVVPVPIFACSHCGEAFRGSQKLDDHVKNLCGGVVHLKEFQSKFGDSPVSPKNANSTFGLMKKVKVLWGPAESIPLVKKSEPTKALLPLLQSLGLSLHSQEEFKRSSGPGKNKTKLLCCFYFLRTLFLFGL